MTISEFTQREREKSEEQILEWLEEETAFYCRKRDEQGQSAANYNRAYHYILAHRDTIQAIKAGAHRV